MDNLHRPEPTAAEMLERALRTADYHANREAEEIAKADALQTAAARLTHEDRRAVEAAAISSSLTAGYHAKERRKYQDEADRLSGAEQARKCQRWNDLSAASTLAERATMWQLADALKAIRAEVPVNPFDCE